VAGSARRIVVEFIGDGNSLSRELNNLQGKSGKFSSAMKAAGKAAAYGLGAGLVIAGGAAFKFAQAAADDAQAAELLAGALERNAAATPGQVKAVESWITAQGKAKGVADDELRPALSRLVTATHNVSKAQDLATLAMDVSAATGKSLESVSTALMKAQNGQVSSLSRLGINTKNAAGETISMEQATARMADQFGGAASEKANTFSGRMDRLKLMMSETGEAIGYKLLPILTSLMEWVQNTAVPAVEDFTREWKKGVGTGGEVRDILTKIKSVLITVTKALWEHKPLIIAVAAAYAFYRATTLAIAAAQGVAAAAVTAYSIATKIAAAATKTWTGIQWLLNAALTANPVGLVIAAIALLAAGIVIAYKKSETFREGVQTVWGWLKKFIGFTPLGALISNFGAVRDAVGYVIDKVKELLDWISKIKMPDVPKVDLNPFGRRAGGNAIDVGNPGAALIESIVKGISKGKVKLQTALDKLGEYIKKHQEKLADLLEKRNAIVDAFRNFTTSIFSTDLSTAEGEGPATIQKLLEAGAARKAKAQQLGSDVQSLLGKGLSKDLLQQMIDAGEAGAEQIHLLASGTQADIDQANADNQATRDALEAAGLAVGDAIYGAGIAQEEANIKLADTIRDKLAELLDLQDKNTVVELWLDGHKILWSLKKIKKQNGGHLGLGDKDPD